MNRIKELRKSKHITQLKLAEILTTSQANISGWEIGKWEPDSRALAKMADYFGVTVDYILGRDYVSATSFPNSKDELFTKISTLSDEEVAKAKDYLDFIVSQRK